jgi:AcrR family transcriptional regulator
VNGLSTGAVYRYFTGKDEIMSAAVAAGTAGLAQAIAPILADPDPPALPEFVGQLISTGLPMRSRTATSTSLEWPSTAMFVRHDLGLIARGRRLVQDHQRLAPCPPRVPAPRVSSERCSR